MLRHTGQPPHLPHVSPLQQLGLTQHYVTVVNACFLRCPWQHAFPVAMTTVSNFTGVNGVTTPVSMMRSIGGAFRLMSAYSPLECAALEIMFADTNLAMWLLLPDRHSSVAALGGALTHEHLEALMLRSEQQSVSVLIPKFRCAFNAPLNDELQAMGVRDAFDRTRADLSRMSYATPVTVSDVVHGAVIEVDEHGTGTGNHGSGGVMVSSSVSNYSSDEMNCDFQFDCDRPFMFVVVHRSLQQIIFIGKVDMLMPMK